MLLTELETTLRTWFDAGNIAAIVGLAESLKSARDRAEQSAAADQAALVKMARERAKRVAADDPEREPIADAAEAPAPRPVLRPRQPVRRVPQVRQAPRRQAAPAPRRRRAVDATPGEALDLL